MRLLARMRAAVVRFVSTLRLDVLLLARHRVLVVSAISAVVLGLGLRFFFEPSQAASVLPVFFLLMVGATTYFVAAALVLLEKAQGTLQVLRTSPLRPRTYIASKVITLGAVLVGECAVVYGLGFAGTVERWWPMALGLVALAGLQVTVSLGQVAPHAAVTSFLIPGGALIGTVLQLPVFFILEAGPPWIWYLIPTQGALLLMVGSFRDLADWQWIYAVVTSVLAFAWGLRWARRRFDRHLGWSAR